MALIPLSTLQVLAFTSSVKVARQLILYRAIHPIVIPEDGHLWSKNKDKAISHAKKLGFCRAGDTVVVVSGEVESLDAAETAAVYFNKVAPD